MRSFAPAVVVVSGLVLLAAPACAQPEVFPDVAWTVQPAFGTAGEGRDNVSGATCLATPPARTLCLVVNDSTRFAQLFTINGTTIRPGPFIGVTAATSPGTVAINPNMEGAANDGRFFYVVTSRGRTVLTAPVDTDFLVGRFPADSTGSGPTPVPFASGTVPGLQVSARIRTALTAGIPVPGLAGQRIDRTNAEIQGIAVQVNSRGTDATMHLGFRAPVLGGKAFIVSALVSEVFASSGPLNLTVTPVALGLDVGIRDLGLVADGVLILAASNRAVQQRAALFLLKNNGQLKHIADFAEPTDRKAEALLVLFDDVEFLALLLMFDGVPNGTPLQYVIPR
jgi:hypothetical protein